MLSEACARLAHLHSPSSLGEHSKNRRPHPGWRSIGEWSRAEMPKNRDVGKGGEMLDGFCSLSE